LGVFRNAEAEEIEKDVMTEIDEAVRFAEQSPSPNHDESLTDVYA
jgi:TPP-dependent pyruvate/acetoin dehydrogenase alpha subunit